MSFRLRALTLIVVVTITASAATALVTLTIATRQAQRTVTAGEMDIQRITAELTRYGREHESWDGVAGRVATLAQETGQRIRLVTESGRVLTDTEAFQPVSGTPRAIDARPVLQLPTLLEPGGATNTPAGGGTKMAIVAIGTYHYQHRLRRCLIDAGITVSTVPGPLGIDETQIFDRDPRVEECKRNASASADPQADYVTPVVKCSALTQDALRDCLRDTFLQQIADVAPEPLRVYIGSSRVRPAPVPVMPVALAATLIALITGIVALLLSRHVLKPIRALTGAAGRLGQGRLSGRVAVAGRDELAMLSHAFNRMAQALQDSEERQRQMTADIAHELRSPLTNLRGYLEALTDGTLTPSRDLFVSLREEALLQQRIIDDLQDLSLAEAGKLAYRRERVDLCALVRTFHQPGPVTVRTVTHAPVYVEGDPDRLRQVVGNLVRNAISASGAGGSVVLTTGHNGQWAELAVADTGKGIGAGDLPHVFDRFWRADRARPRGSGVGLGLAIVRQIVTDHGGTIEVSSTEGKGTIFVIRLPVSQGAGAPA